jgi:hypothetical protein
VGQRVSESRVRSGRRAVLFRVYLPCQHLRLAGPRSVLAGAGALFCALGRTAGGGARARSRTNRTTSSAATRGQPWTGRTAAVRRA